MRVLTLRLSRTIVVTLLLAVILGSGSVAAQSAGSLTVMRSDGSETPAPVAGVPLTVNRVKGLEPTTQEVLAGMVQDNPDLLRAEPADYFGPTVTAYTGADGAAVFRGLERGVYLVREAPSRVGNVAYLTASAFLVSVPSVEAEADNPDVVIQTKVQPVDITLHTDKSVIRPGESVLFWSLASVPDVDIDGRLFQFSVIHAFDPLLNVLRVARVRITGADGDLILTEGVDYTVEIRAAATNGTFAKGTTLVGVTFTPEGLKKLAARRAADPSTRVVTDIDTTVSASAKDGDRLYNRAYVLPDGWDRRWDELGADDIESNLVQLQVADFAPSDPDGSSHGPWWPWWPWWMTSESGQPDTEVGEPIDTSPGSWNQSDESGASGPVDRVRASLASTGASVVWLVVIASLSLFVGLILIGRQRRRNEEEAEK